ncbi:MAG: hypothetical protein GX352_08610 [Clostridiales bacterium]|nr:hypothetical protein [Clostridiales bacterium]
MSYKITDYFPDEIIHERGDTCITLYQPTFRHRPENQQDIIRFKNLVRRIQNSLLQKHSASETDLLLKPFKDMAQDRAFWNNAKDGLAILSNKNRTVVYRLNTPVKELAVVSDSFHIKPLLRKFQSADRYHLLGINRKKFVLYEGDRYGFEEIKLGDDIPTTIEEVLGDRYTEPHLNPGAYGGVGAAPMFHGHGGRKEEVEKDTEKFFRYVDKLVLDKFSNVDQIPLILVALEEHHGLFRSLSNNQYLIDKGIRRNYETLTDEEIKDEAWKVIESIHLNQIQQTVDRFRSNWARFLASDDLSQIARAAIEHRVETLMLEADNIQPGKINRETGEIVQGDLMNPEFDDVLDDLAEMVLNSKGDVVVLAADKMPTDTGAAAIYRF